MQHLIAFILYVILVVYYTTRLDFSKILNIVLEIDIMFEINFSQESNLFLKVES